jgi:CBS domain-containing protein
MPFRDPLQRLYPALDESGTLVGVVPQQSILDAGAEVTQMRALLVPDPLVVYEHDTLRAVAGLFADHAVTAAPVVDAAEPGRLLGIVTVQQLLDGRLRDLAEERHRERLIIIPRWRWRWGGVRAGRNGSGPAGEVPVAGATDGTTGTASGLPADIPSGIPSDIPSDIPPAGRGDDHSDDRSA